ncbi:M15 family metallopeptidase [Actinomyces minihominis]|uniref:M15 family metallopeptidase n=1 Tax=Actinomyces minihominis TaxID=2002838 RepID=UPI000C07C83F|nr:M15 family metallopeptidase [Actinomyces minihominis]
MAVAALLSVPVVRGTSMEPEPDYVARETTSAQEALRSQKAAAQKRFEEDVEAFLASLPAPRRIALLGESSVDPADLTDGELNELLEAGAGPTFRVESDRRLAASLPDLSDLENGRIPDEMLCPVPWPNRYEYRVLCVALPNLVRLNEAFNAEFGRNLPVQSGYRSFEQQQLVHQNSPTMTTLPGASNHSWGLAVDFDIDNYTSYDLPEVKWLVENAPSYGWRNPTHEAFATSREEPWHFEFGTVYPELEGEGFNGPQPEVKYLFKLPEGWRTRTIYSEG